MTSRPSRRHPPPSAVPHRFGRYDGRPAAPLGELGWERS
jgi:hypothetical protein